MERKRLLDQPHDQPDIRTASPQPCSTVPLTDIASGNPAEAALRASEERFRLLFEYSPDAIWLLDPPAPDGSAVIVDCNPAAAEMHGYTRDELIGQPIGMFVVNPEDPERFRRDARGLEEYWHTGMSQGQDRHRRKDGTV